MESLYRWYAEQGCPKINPDYSWTSTVAKALEETEITLTSKSDSDSYYSDSFDSAKARDPTPPTAHIGTATTQIGHSIEACYMAPVGHFHEKHEVPKRVEVQHWRYSNPRLEITIDTDEGEAVHTADPTPTSIRQSTRRRGAVGFIEDS